MWIRTDEDRPDRETWIRGDKIVTMSREVDDVWHVTVEGDPGSIYSINDETMLLVKDLPARMWLASR